MGASLQQMHHHSNRRRYQHTPVSEINVTPLVDVMLVLLVIFMITSPMLVSGVAVDLPETQAKPMEKQEEPLAISINKKGQLFIQEHQITLENLVPKLKAITKEKIDTRILLRGDKAVDYGLVMKILGAINDAGYTKVALIAHVSSK